MNTDSRSLSTVTRAFEILDALWELDGAGPTEIANHLDIPDSTAYEYLRALESTPWVRADRGTYSLSSYVLTMAGKMRHRNQLFHVAKEEMRRAAVETGELVGLTIEDGGLGVILHQEEGERALSLGTYLGAATPLHTNAAGKAILAFLPEQRRSTMLDRQNLPGRTPHTITEPEVLRRELDGVTRLGYAIDGDEQVIGMGMAAVPILVAGDVLGSICIVAPTERVKNRSYQESLVESLQEIAQTIAINYQYGR